MEQNHSGTGLPGKDQDAIFAALSGGQDVEAPGDSGSALRFTSGLLAALRRSGSRVGTGGSASGRWLSETVVDQSERLSLRTATELRTAYPGLSDNALAQALVSSAARSTAAIGAAAGAAMAVQELLPPAWLALPVQVAAETAAVALIEIKLIAELHAVFGRDLPPSKTTKGWALARMWAERGTGAGLSFGESTASGKSTAFGGSSALGESMARGTKREVLAMVRRRATRRAGVNLSGLAPFLVGAAAGGVLNARATRKLGEKMIVELSKTQHVRKGW